MSPEYKGVDIPPQHTWLFEALVEDMGGHYGSKVATANEMQSELQTKWIVEAGLARQRVAKFVQPQTDPAVEIVIKTGISQLVADALDLFSFYDNPFDGQEERNFNWPVIKQVIADVFVDSLPEEVPDYCKPLPTPRGVVLSIGKDRLLPIFPPRIIACLIDKYGLTGDKINKSKTAEDYRVSQSVIAKSTDRGLREVRKLLDFRGTELLIP